MHVIDLLQAVAKRGLKYCFFGSPENIKIIGITSNSRLVKPGFLFVAINGITVDGHDYLHQAIAKGAVALLVERFDFKLVSTLQVQVSDSRLALALVTDELAACPTKDMILVGITGTNGKTTTSYLVESILAVAGLVGLISTIEIRYGNIHYETNMTTPEPADLATFFANMRAIGVSRAVIEVSSHALDQRRVDGCLFDIAVFTNVSRDHLDYHRDLASYFVAKCRLFTELLPAAKFAGKIPVAIICVDDPYAGELIELCLERGINVTSYGFDRSAQIYLAQRELMITGSNCQIAWPGGQFDLYTPLVGEYNLKNILAAVGVGLVLGYHPDQIKLGLKSVSGVPGRLERVISENNKPEGPVVFVDYAHTDDALSKVLATLKTLIKGRLICVFGAGGDRDHGKRLLMGQAVAKGADLAVLTSDNPRSENPMDIIAMIEQGFKYAGIYKTDCLKQAESSSYIIEPNRALAITLAIEQAHQNDVVVIAGKGHENYQLIAGKKYYFDDRKEAAQALARRFNRITGTFYA